MSGPHTPGPIQLFHGTTDASAEIILEKGWVPLEVNTLVAEVAEMHGYTGAQVWAELQNAPQTYLAQGERGQWASFSLDKDVAAHDWAQRASEARREALWSVWRLNNPDRAANWPTHADGHLWELVHLAVNSPAVIEVAVSYDELVEWEAKEGGFRIGPLPSEERVRPGLLAEIAIGTPLCFPASDLTVHQIPRHVDWDLYALLLGLEREEFIEQAEAGELGSPGSGNERLPGYRRWWPLSTVTEVLETRGRSRAWSKVCGTCSPSIPTRHQA